MKQSNARKLLILEINEISWELMSPWLNSGKLPNFLRLQKEGTWGCTYADEPGGPEGFLEPWVTWTTFYTGVPYTKHGVKFLEQPLDSISYKRLWEIASSKNRKIGVFASSGTWPPHKVDGFIVPGSFSCDSQTYPEDLRPIQDLNLRYTRSHSPGTKSPSKLEMISRGMKLMKLGLNAKTVMRVIGGLMEVKLHKERDWKKVCLQPIVNLPFFEALYRKYSPDFATFHTNHAAHYQHRFMRAYKPDAYPDVTDDHEVKKYGGAIQYGYEVADWLVGQFFKLIARDPNVILCVASSMGQQPYIPPKYDNVAPITCRIRSIEKLLDILEIKDRCEYFSTMAPQWNLRIADAALRRETIEHLMRARYEPVGKSIYAAMEVQDMVVITPVSHHGLGSKINCVFHGLRNEPQVPFSELTIQEDETRKSGCHHPVGLLGFYGKSVPEGRNFGQINNLDVAPTLLELMNLPVPEYMTGKSISTKLSK
jgi:hypothetical protein